MVTLLNRFFYYNALVSEQKQHRKVARSWCRLCDIVCQTVDKCLWFVTENETFASI